MTEEQTQDMHYVGARLGRTVRTHLSPSAAEIFDDFEQRVISTIINKAWGLCLKDNRREIGEDDILRATKTLRLISSSSRKWFVRVAIAMVFSLLVVQFKAFSQLKDVSLELQLMLYFPFFIFACWMIAFSYTFRDEWL